MSGQDSLLWVTVHQIPQNPSCFHHSGCFRMKTFPLSWQRPLEQCQPPTPGTLERAAPGGSQGLNALGAPYHDAYTVPILEGRVGLFWLNSGGGLQPHSYLTLKAQSWELVVTSGV